MITAKWVAQDAGIGAGVDSYFEYLVKGAILLQDKELMSMFLGEQFVFCVKGPRNASLAAPLETLHVEEDDEEFNRVHSRLFLKCVFVILLKKL